MFNVAWSAGCGVPAVLLCAAVLTAQAPNLPVRSGIIFARIETNKSTYHLGEAIKLRLTLINKSGQHIFIWPSAPYAMSNLKVFDAKGKPLPSTGSEGEICPAGCGGHPYTIKLDPGKSMVIQFDDRHNHWELRQWADIKRWGYTIKQLGSYTLIASPDVAAYVAGGPEFTTSPADTSNEVHIRMIQ